MPAEGVQMHGANYARAVRISDVCGAIALNRRVGAKHGLTGRILALVHPGYLPFEPLQCGGGFSGANRGRTVVAVAGAHQQPHGV